MLTIQLTEDLEVRIKALADLTKRPENVVLSEVLERVLEDLEDAYRAAAAYERFLASGEKAIPLEEVMKEYGLED